MKKDFRDHNQKVLPELPILSLSTRYYKRGLVLPRKSSLVAVKIKKTIEEDLLYFFQTIQTYFKSTRFSCQ
jgi:hypothetical protein